MLAGGKFQGREAVKNKDYLAATHIYTEVRTFVYIMFYNAMTGLDTSTNLAGHA
jgi:hypothetical protein